jgi:pimeloyl-ACP methyl ester carboxylesterase
LKGELCSTLTADGLELHGFVASPEGGVPDTAVLHIHGTAGNFYENRFIENVGRVVLGSGLGFLAANTRGRDYLADFIFEKPGGKKEYRQIGAIHEIFEECVEDIGAWIAYLRSTGIRHVILQGHSHGALKVTYYLHRTTDPAVTGLILLSPSDDFGCQRSRLGDRFDEAMGAARAMVKEGRGGDIMPAQYFHYPVSAVTYLDVFDEGTKVKMFNLSRTDIREFPELKSIRVPVLALLGSVDEAFLGTPEEYLSLIEAELENAPGFTGGIIHGAPHNYLDFEEEIAGHIGRWLAGGKSLP